MQTRPAIVCAGEILWDVLPGGALPGGAPMNVAVHASNLGAPAALISRIGRDRWGEDLLAYLASKGVPADWVQTDDALPTGLVQADMRNPAHVVYTIEYPSAWDAIQWTEALSELVAAADMLVFGSLASRSEASFLAISRLIDAAKLRVFDINLRKPHYTRDRIADFLERCHLAKLNDEELAQLSDWFGLEGDEPEQLQQLSRQFGLRSVIVTHGGKGAALLEDGQYYFQPGIEVQVQDTIGCGDSFLAAFLAQTLAGTPAQERLRYAAATGALVATYAGATPLIRDADIRALMAQMVS